MQKKEIIHSVFHFLKTHPFLLFIAFIAWLVSSAFHSRPAAHESWQEASYADYTLTKKSVTPTDTNEEGSSPTIADKTVLPPNTPAHSSHLNEIGLVRYALSLQGTPYRYGGLQTDGFDCSGFVHHVFDRYGISMNRTSRDQAKQGERIQLENIQKGDLLFFTGTNPKERRVGHVGIVSSEAGEPVRFVHSSSNGGVKVSELSGYYTTRFMYAKRVR